MDVAKGLAGSGYFPARSSRSTATQLGNAVLAADPEGD